MGRKKISTNERKSFSEAKELYRKRIKTVMKKPKELAEICGIQYFFMIKSMNGNLQMDSSKSLNFLMPKMEAAFTKGVLSPQRFQNHSQHEQKVHSGSNYRDVDFRIEMPPSESPSHNRGRKRKGYHPPMSSFNNSFNQELSGVSGGLTPFSVLASSRLGEEHTPKREWGGLFASEPSAILSRKASGYSSRKASCLSSSSGAGPGPKHLPEQMIQELNSIETKNKKQRKVSFSVKSKKKVRFDDDIDSRYELRSHNRSIRHSAFVSGEISRDQSFFSNSHLLDDSS